MAKFEPGDILEIALTSSQKHPKWAGLTIEVTSRYLQGRVLKECSPNQGYKIGNKISWCEPDAFTYVQASLQEYKDKYLSPFSGRWE